MTWSIAECEKFVGLIADTVPIGEKQWVDVASQWSRIANENHYAPRSFEQLRQKYILENILCRVLRDNSFLWMVDRDIHFWGLVVFLLQLLLFVTWVITTHCWACLGLDCHEFRMPMQLHTICTIHTVSSFPPLVSCAATV